MQLPAPSYDEAAVPSYELPALLCADDGTPIRSASAWQALRRPQLLESFRRHVYGRFELDVDVAVTRVVSDAPACGGLAARTELDVMLRAAGAEPVTLRVLVFTPRGPGPFPAFVGLNLFGNQTVHADPGIRLAQGWLPENADLGLVGHRATDDSRGMHSGRFPVEMLVARGFALVTAYAGDIDPDFDDGFQNGVHALLPTAAKSVPDAPGTLAAWAWGLSRIREALAELPQLDGQRLVVFGHSRLGKTALWAAAEDERFALSISNESGCGGAALSRRCFGERLLHINRRFPHWFCPAFHAYNDREHELPVDQHQLLSLIAPRPLYVASAAADLWADPRGERLACEAAAPVYELFGLPGITTTAAHGAPPRIGYHVRPGRHDITPRDFWHYLEFAEQHLVSA
jgi:hypothetical protein